VESLALALRNRGTETFVSHSLLSVDERRRAETAFAEARDCVIVSTSTLELGIDVGNLDRVLQIGALRTVASFLRLVLGRAGRRPGTSRRMLFLATDDDELLRAAPVVRAGLRQTGAGPEAAASPDRAAASRAVPAGAQGGLRNVAGVAHWAAARHK